MYLALCMDGSMLVGFLVFLLIVGVVFVVPTIFILIALGNWVEACLKRRFNKDSPAADLR